MSVVVGNPTVLESVDGVALSVMGEASEVMGGASTVVPCGCSVVVGWESVVVVITFPESIPTNTGMELGPCPTLVEAYTSIRYLTLAKSSPVKISNWVPS